MGGGRYDMSGPAMFAATGVYSSGGRGGSTGPEGVEPGDPWWKFLYPVERVLLALLMLPFVSAALAGVVVLVVLALR